MSLVAPLLAIDTAGGACSAALWDGSEVVAGAMETMQRGQSERLIPMIEEVLSTSGRGYEDLAAIAVTTGPGGFTGVRLGLATARALALSLGLPVIGITSFQAIAAAAAPMLRTGETLAVALDSKREELFLQLFSGDEDLPGRTLGEPGVLLPADAAKALPEGPLALAGEAASLLSGALGSRRHRLLPISAADARAFAPWAATRPLPAPDAARPQPLYLRPPDVSFPKSRAAGT